MSKDGLIKSSSYLVNSQIFNSILGFLFMMYFNRELLKEQMAVYALSLIIPAFTFMFTNFGLSTYAIREVPFLLSQKRVSEVKALIRNSTLFFVIINFFLYLCLLLFLSNNISLLFMKNTTYIREVKIIIFSSFFVGLFGFLSLFFNALQEFKKISILNIIFGVINRILAIVFYVFWGFEGFLIGIAMGKILIVLAQVLLLRKYLFNFDRGTPLSKVIKNCFFYYLNGFSRYAVGELDQLVIAVFFKPELLASFFVAKKIVTYFYVLVDSITRPLVPKFSEIKAFGREKLISFFGRTLEVSTLLFLPISIGAACISYFMLSIYGGEKYIGAVYILMVFCFSIFPCSIRDILGGLILSKEEPVEVFKVRNFAAISTILLYFPLLKILGPIGIAISCLISASLTIVYSFKIIGRDFSFPWKIFENSLFGSSVMFLIIFFMQKVYYNRLVILAYIISGILIYTIILVQFLRPDTINSIKEIVPKKFSYMIDMLVKSKIGNMW